MTVPQPRPRRPKPLDACQFAPEIGSFRLHLAAEGKAPKTVRTYTEAVAWFAAGPPDPAYQSYQVERAAGRGWSGSACVAARALDRYLRVRSKHAQAWRPQLWLGVNNRGPMTANGIYQMIARRGRQCGVDAWTHRFRHHFSHTWLDRGGAEGDLMELNGSSSPQTLRRYGASARSARARRTYDRVMEGGPAGHAGDRNEIGR